MKATAISALLLLGVAASSCSRATDQSTAEPTPTPNLRADADRLQSAINKAAEQRKQESSPTPTATAP